MLAFIDTVVTIAFIIITNFYSHIFLGLLVSGNVSHLPLLRTHCQDSCTYTLLLSAPFPIQLLLSIQ